MKLRELARLGANKMRIRQRVFSRHPCGAEVRQAAITAHGLCRFGVYLTHRVAQVSECR